MKHQKREFRETEKSKRSIRETSHEKVVVEAVSFIMKAFLSQKKQSFG